MHLLGHYNDDGRESAHGHYNVPVSVHIIMIAMENELVNIIMHLLGHYNDDCRESAHKHYNESVSMYIIMIAKGEQTCEHYNESAWTL